MDTSSPYPPSIVLSNLDDEDPEAVRRAIHRRSEKLKQQELERAFNRLTARSDLTQEQKEILTQMASEIVDGILATPDSMLECASESDDISVQTAIELFDPNR